MAEEVVITRIFDAPRELVWKAWTEPERVMRWWGPRDFTSPAYSIDLRVGGEYLGCMRSADGQDYWSKGVFREIVAPERLVMTDSFADEEGNTVPASHYGMSGDWPVEMLVTVRLEGQDGKTELTVRHSGLEGHSKTDLKNMRQGWNESLDKLAKAVDTWKGESAVLATIAAMPAPDRAMGERLHAIIKASAPVLSPRLWYGMPAYAKDGKVVCFFQSAQKFKTRYATFGFQHEANLDEGGMWPVAFALKELTAAEEARIGALVKKAVS